MRAVLPDSGSPRPLVGCRPVPGAWSGLTCPTRARPAGRRARVQGSRGRVRTWHSAPPYPVSGGSSAPHDHGADRGRRIRRGL